jgi:PIN domain nuclease of toxin-antitoxin system
MKLLLDTHVLLWWLNDNALLRPRVRSVIADSNNTTLISIASFWELSIKARKFGYGDRGSEVWKAALAEGFEVLPIVGKHLEALENLQVVAGHGDPFDHLILAQAAAERAAVITHDRHMTGYGIPCIGVS